MKRLEEIKIDFSGKQPSRVYDKPQHFGAIIQFMCTVYIYVVLSCRAKARQVGRALLVKI